MGGGRVFGRIKAGGYGAVLALASGGAPPYLPPRASACADARGRRRVWVRGCAYRGGGGDGEAHSLD